MNDKLKCECCDNDSEDKLLYIHARCHLESGLWVAVDQENKLLWITCKACGKYVTSFKLEGLNYPSAPVKPIDIE